MSHELNASGERVLEAIRHLADRPDDIEGKALGDLERTLVWVERFLIDLEDWRPLSSSIREYGQEVFR